ncbi:MAG: CRISPR-associated endonuclease Cas2 [Candidatus Uhrbacteria bacterium]|nr:CRISPR-associated endonuclease Cas2 [Candidatus Uhrbacteria bacterium]
MKLTRGEIIKAVLLTVGVAGIVAVGLTCPGLLQVMKPIYRKRYRADLVRQAVYRLDKKGWLILKQVRNGWEIKLTDRGRAELLAYELGEKQFKQSKKWDQKWRCLIFDIPEKRKSVREQVRQFLQKFGFERLQDSVWVFPYECREILELLRTKYGIRSEALYLVVESLDNDRWLRKQFGLKS